MPGILDRIAQILRAEAGAARNQSPLPPLNADSEVWLDDDAELRAAIDQAVREAGSRVKDEVDVACDVLGVSRHVTLAELRTAYRAAVKKWHPDRYVNGTPAEQEAAATHTRKINAAYLFLHNWITKGAAQP
jgi:DnaJ-domain-containing protein 1